MLMEMGHGCHNSAQGVVYYEQSLTIRRDVSDLVGEAACLEHLGLLQTYLGNTQVCLLPAMFRAWNVGLFASDLFSLLCWILCASSWKCVWSNFSVHGSGKRRELARLPKSSAWAWVHQRPRFVCSVFGS